MFDREDDRLKTLTDLIAAQAITYASAEQKIISPVGGPQNWLIDLRSILLNVDALNIITDMFWDAFQDQLPFQIGGMEVAAMPLVTAVLMKAQQRGLSTSGFIIRKERKTTGLGKLIEGTLNNDPIILVDDILNSGASLEKARAALEQAGKRIDQVFVILNFQSQAGKQWASQYNVKVHHLSTIEPFGLELYQHGSATYYAPKDLVIFGNADHDVMAYDAKTGKIFAGSGDRHLYIIDAQSFEVIEKMDCHARVYSSPKLIDGHVVFGTCGGRLIELNPETLEIEGQAQLPDAIANSISVSDDNDVLYVSTVMNEIYAIKRDVLDLDG